MSDASDPRQPRRRLHAKPEALAARGLAPVPRILLTVKLDDGTFEASLAIPIDAGLAGLKAAGEAWVELMFQALKIAQKF